MIFFFFCYLYRQSSVTFCCRDRPHTNPPAWSSQTLPSLDHYPSLRVISRVLYSLLTSMLCCWVTAVDSRSFSYGIHPCGHIYFVKEFLVSLKFYCAHRIEMIVAWKPFLTFYCFLNMLQVNCLALDSPKTDPERWSQLEQVFPFSFFHFLWVCFHAWILVG